jgi:hypothetical protein
MIVSHLLLILHKQIQFYIFMFEAWNVAKGRKVQGGRILSQGTVSAFCQDWPMCHGSRHPWSQSYPLKPSRWLLPTSQSSPLWNSLAYYLFEQSIWLHGVPHTVLSDECWQLESDLVKSVCSLIGTTNAKLLHIIHNVTGQSNATIAPRKQNWQRS